MKDLDIIKGYEHVKDEKYGLWYMMGGKVEDVVIKTHTPSFFYTPTDVTVSFLTILVYLLYMKRDKSMNPDNMEFLIFAKERFMGEGLNTLTYDRVGKKNAYEGLYAHIKVLL